MDVTYLPAPWRTVPRHPIPLLECPSARDRPRCHRFVRTRLTEDLDGLPSGGGGALDPSSDAAAAAGVAGDAAAGIADAAEVDPAAAQEEASEIGAVVGGLRFRW